MLRESSPVVGYQGLKVSFHLIKTPNISVRKCRSRSWKLLKTSCKQAEEENWDQIKTTWMLWRKKRHPDEQEVCAVRLNVTTYRRSDDKFVFAQMPGLSANGRSDLRRVCRRSVSARRSHSEAFQLLSGSVSPSHLHFT